MNLNRAKELRKKMPWKKIFYDTIHNCYRLICPTELYEYQDEMGKWYPRKNVESLFLIHSS